VKKYMEFYELAEAFVSHWCKKNFHWFGY